MTTQILTTKVELKKNWFDIQFQIIENKIKIISVTSQGDEVVTAEQEDELIAQHIKENYNF